MEGERGGGGRQGEKGEEGEEGGGEGEEGGRNEIERGKGTGDVQCTCTYMYTSVKIVQLNEYGCRGAPCEKSWKQGNPLSNTIKDISTIMRNPLSELCREGYA